MANRKPVSIYTIGRDLGVSPSTVSRALNNSPAVSPGICRKVQVRARRLGFKPRVVRNRVTNICALVQQYEGHALDFGPFLARTLEGIAEYCRHEQLEISIYSADVGELNRCDIVRELRRRQADAAVVIRATRDSRYIKQMEQQQFPYFCLMGGLAGQTDKLVEIDDEHLAYEATEHLLSLGHRTVGLLVNAPHTTVDEMRRHGYSRALRDHGIEPRAELMLEPDLARDSSVGFGCRAIETLLTRCPETTAVFAVGETVARCVLGWAYQRNVPVPQRLSVVGLGDSEDTAFLCPPLTIVHVPYKRIGYEGAHQAHRLTRHLPVLLPKGPARRQLAGTLILRSSTARPSPQRGQETRP